MQQIIFDRPYQFVPPHRGTWIPTLLEKMRADELYLKWFEGVESFELRGVEHLRSSLRAGHGILLAPNHCRYADPIAMAAVSRAVGVFLYTMASWHLFNKSWLQSWAIRLCGGFSIYREGVDKKSLDTAIEILAEGIRPLVIFPEGTVYRTNDRLHPLLDGIAFLARMASRRRLKESRPPVVVHPIAIKYLYRGDVQQDLEQEVLELEQRLSWEDQFAGGDMLSRVIRIDEALLTLREIQWLGSPQDGTVAARKHRLIAHLLDGLEQHHLGRTFSQDSVVSRIKQLRTRIVPLWQRATGEPRRQLWNEIRATYVAQIIDGFDRDYLADPTDTRILESIERFQEDLNDEARRHRPLHCIIQIDTPIEVSGEKPPRGQPDPIVAELAARIQAMLDQLSQEAKPWPVPYQVALQEVHDTLALTIDSVKAGLPA
ncbi:MAG: 1-acyl-sn-glycerol-3-phosphate acyltransferase [Pirellulaceae bacterium]|nr:MAG: 1-acyl-sn-glycerol-3-phosphate acyltransferase [Pirellulaceae bacterium]